MSLQAVSGTGSASKVFAGKPRRGPLNGWVVSNPTSAGKGEAEALVCRFGCEEKNKEPGDHK
jgi:hypothetical protein